jgi:hypothetical protein
VDNVNNLTAARRPGQTPRKHDRRRGRTTVFCATNVHLLFKLDHLARPGKFDRARSFPVFPGLTPEAKLCDGSSFRALSGLKIPPGIVLTNPTEKMLLSARKLFFRPRPKKTPCT